MDLRELCHTDILCNILLLFKVKYNKTKNKKAQNDEQPKQSKSKHHISYLSNKSITLNLSISYNVLLTCLSYALKVFYFLTYDLQLK